jgi:hypothetical protein
MADQNRIRARLSIARQQVQRRLQQRQQPTPEGYAGLEKQARTAELELEHERRRRKQLEAALADADVRRTESERRDPAVDSERTRSDLERELAEALRDLEQARGGRDRAQAQLRATEVDLQKSRAALEAALARGRQPNDDAAVNRRSHRKGKQLRAEKRIAALEGELCTERELRKYFELALQVVQQQQAERAKARPALGWGVTANAPAAPEETDRASQEVLDPKPADANRDGEPEPPRERSPDGWGVPLEAFPVDEPEERSAGVGKGAGSTQPTGKRRRLPSRVWRRGG